MKSVKHEFYSTISNIAKKHDLLYVMTMDREHRQAYNKLTHCPQNQKLWILYRSIDNGVIF